MAAKKTKKYAVVGGERHLITGEKGRYFICGDIQIRKSRAETETVKEEAEKE